MPQQRHAAVRFRKCATTLICVSALAGLCAPTSGATLQSEWTFDGGKGTEAKNSVNNGAAARMRAQWATGKFGSAVYFADEPGATVSVPDGPGVQFGTASFSISCWIWPTKLSLPKKGQYRRLLCKSSFPGTFWTLDIFDSGRVMFAMRDSEDQTGTTRSNGAIAESVWTHLAIVVDREKHLTRYFLNGRQDCAQPFAKTFKGELNVPGKPLLISTWRKYVGLLDNVRFHTGALSEEAVAAEHERGKATYVDAAFQAKPRQIARFPVPVPRGEKQTTWDMTRLSQTPKTFPAPEIKAKEEGVRGLFFESVPFRGKPTRVFAWYGRPEETSGKMAGMVLVHGGGGTAFSSWVKLWMDRGYAAIAMDTCGCIPVRAEKRRWTRTEHGGPGGWGGFANVDEPIGDQWPYHAVSAVVMAHSLLRSFPEVDADRIGLTGISWGGYLTSIVSGVDPRFKFAAPVYGCGFLGENSAWLGRFHAMEREMAVKWLTHWDPSQYLPFAKLPMLWCNGTNDHFFPPDSHQKSYRVTRGPRALCIKVRMPHSHPPAGDPPEITHFAHSILKGKAPLPTVTGQGCEGRRVWATYRSEVPVSEAELNYTLATGNWERRRWERGPAVLDQKAGKATADLPQGTTVYYINLIDERGMIVSTEHEEIGER